MNAHYMSFGLHLLELLAILYLLSALREAKGMAEASLRIHDAAAHVSDLISQGLDLTQAAVTSLDERMTARFATQMIKDARFATELSELRQSLPTVTRPSGTSTSTTSS